MSKRLLVKMKFYVGSQLVNIVDGQEVPLSMLTPHDIHIVTEQFPMVMQRVTGLRVEVETEMIDD